MPGLNTSPVAQDSGYQGFVHTIVERIGFTQEGSVFDLKKKLPARASVIGGGVHVVTAFNVSGTDTLDVGFRDGSSADDPDAYATLLLLTAVGFVPLDELGAASNIRQTRDTILTFRYNGENNNATAGEAVLVVNYVLPVSG